MAMAKNPPIGDGHRIGAVRNRSQVYNPKSENWTKRGPDGRFMGQKSDGTPFKGVRKDNIFTHGQVLRFPVVFKLFDFSQNRMQGKV